MTIPAHGRLTATEWRELCASWVAAGVAEVAFRGRPLTADEVLHNDIAWHGGTIRRTISDEALAKRRADADVDFGE